MHIEIVSVGDELVNGMVVNTNAAFLGRSLFEKGYQVSRHTVVSDEPELLDQELRAALSRSPLVITTGGLGPTLDDHTRKIAAALFESDFAYNEKVAKDLKARFGEHLISLRDQATIPVKAAPLLNPVGTAPGLVFSAKGRLLILLPGVPLEMQALFLGQALPLLQEQFPVRENLFFAQLHFCLLVESQIDPLLRELKKRFTQVHVGIYPAYGTVSVIMSCKEQNQLNSFKRALAEHFTTHLFSTENQRIEEALQSWFIAKGKRLALAESCTGGAIAHQITSIPGASKYFLGSFVTYCNSFKSRFLGVLEETLEKEGAVSAECVKQMLAGVLDNCDADVAVAVSGIAGPEGGSLQKPVGTIWAAIGERGKPADVGSFYIPGLRAKIIQAASNCLLGALWRKMAYEAQAFPLPIYNWPVV